MKKTNTFVFSFGSYINLTVGAVMPYRSHEAFTHHLTYISVPI